MTKLPSDVRGGLKRLLVLNEIGSDRMRWPVSPLDLVSSLVMGSCGTDPNGLMGPASSFRLGLERVVRNRLTFCAKDSGRLPLFVDGTEKTCRSEAARSLDVHALWKLCCLGCGNLLVGVPVTVALRPRSECCGDWSDMARACFRDAVDGAVELLLALEPDGLVILGKSGLFVFVRTALSTY